MPRAPCCPGALPLSTLRHVEQGLKIAHECNLSLEHRLFFNPMRFKWEATMGCDMLQSDISRHMISITLHLYCTESMDSESIGPPTEYQVSSLLGHTQPARGNRPVFSTSKRTKLRQGAEPCSVAPDTPRLLVLHMRLRSHIHISFGLCDTISCCLMCCCILNQVGERAGHFVRILEEALVGCFNQLSYVSNGKAPFPSRAALLV